MFKSLNDYTNFNKIQEIQVIQEKQEIQEIQVIQEKQEIQVIQEKQEIQETKNSFLNISSSLSVSNKNNINIYDDEKKLNYYKNILFNYKIFEKYLKEGKNELYSNLKKYKKEFFYIHNYFNKQIFIIDGENLLKSFKMQNIFYNILGNIDYYKYFNYWIYGSKNLCINPYTTLNLSNFDKKIILEKFVKLYLFNYNNIFIISSKNKDFNKVSFIDNNNSLVIPILYESKNIREQDDHLIMFLNKLLINKNAKVISCDKFKWFSENVNILNFRFIYDYDNKETNIEIVDNNVHDLKIFKNNSFLIDNYIYPYIDNKSIITNQLNINSINNIKTDSLVHIFDLIYLQIKIKKYNSELLKRIDNIIDIIINNNCFDFLEKYIKNIVKQKKYFEEFNINYNDIIKCINDFKNICDCYSIIKSIIINYNNYEFIIKVSKLFSKIIFITDIIEENSNKIRKYYSLCENVINPTLEIYRIFILLKKNGFFKRDVL